MNTYADLVELAESGETEGRIANRGGTWFQIEVEVNPDLPIQGVNQPGTKVFASRSTRWTYPVQDLLHNERMREAIRRTATMRSKLAAQR